MSSAYARTERERRFLCAAPPPAHDVVRTRLITDRYVDGTRLRLRKVDELTGSGPTVHKLTQKLPGEPWGELTTIYVSEEEHALLATLPAAVLTKERRSVPPLGYDVFRGPLAGLVLAEVEFADDASAAAFQPPAGCTRSPTTRGSRGASSSGPTLQQSCWRRRTSCRGAEGRLTGMRTN